MNKIHLGLQILTTMSLSKFMGIQKLVKIAFLGIQMM